MTLPVVVHVVYNANEEKISSEDIIELLNKTNLDLIAHNADTLAIDSGFEHLRGAVNVELKWNSNTLINYYPTTHGVFGNDDIHYSSQGGADAWDADLYLNIWICNLAPGIGGYASPPNSIKEKDGIVIDYLKFANIANRSERVLTHELGHWLNLKHLWGVGGCSNDDGIVDTPNQEKASSGCNLPKTSCGSLDMVQNFMDYSNEDCRLFFTKGQVEEMRTTLLNDRKSIVENASIVLSTDDYTNNSSFDIYPNPFQGSFHLSVDLLEAEKIIVFNIQGSVVFEKTITSDHMAFNMENKGLFFVCFYGSENKLLAVEKIVSH